MDPSKIAQVVTALNDALQGDDQSRAVQILLANFDKFEDSGPLREKAALIAAQNGRKKEAVEIFQSVGRHYANSGQPAKAISAARQMLNLMPDSTVLLDHIATLYNIRSPFMAKDGKQLETAEPKEDIELSPELDGEFDEHLDQAIERASTKKGLATQPGTLPPMPLLSLLPQEALRRVLDLIHYEVFNHTQQVMKKDEEVEDLIWSIGEDLVLRDSDKNKIYLIASCSLLGMGGFGQSGRPSEVDVFARPGVELLRLNKKSVTTLSEQFPDFQNRLATLRRHAMNERTLQRHPMFAGLDDGERVEIMERFSGIRVSAGTPIIRQNTLGPGLFIILDGKVDVVRNDDDWEITIATLGAGEVFGEIALVTDAPTVAGCVMAQDGHVLHLSKPDFQELAKSHPSVQAYMESLADERIEDGENTLSADDLSEVD